MILIDSFSIYRMSSNLIEVEAISDDHRLQRQDANPRSLRDLSKKNQKEESQFTHWVITWNNAHAKIDGMTVDNTRAFLWRFFDFQLSLGIKYMVWALEKGATGTEHYQIYLQVKVKKRWVVMKNKLRPKGMWVAPAVDPKNARDYILREGDHVDKDKNAGGQAGLIEGPWEHGTFEKPSQGSRTDLNNMTQMVISGSSMREIALSDPATFVKYHGGIQKLTEVLAVQKRSTMTKLFIYTGVPGSGKSHKAFEEAREYLGTHNLPGDVYVWRQPTKLGDKIWFHGYQNERVMVIDEFYGTVDINFFKLMVDKYPLTVEVKNGHKDFLVEAIWITSNKPWTSWWGVEALSDIQRAAIERRITKVEEFTTVYREPAQQADFIDEDLPLITIHGDMEGQEPESITHYTPATQDVDAAMFERLADLRREWNGLDCFGNDL